MTSPTAPAAGRAAAVHHSFRINQFLQGAITTEHGLRGSFVGPVDDHPDHATSNGLPSPSGTTRGVADPAVAERPAANGGRPWDCVRGLGARDGER